ncbi:MAG: 1-deoxy-D-xylulose-5-phosphate reductoisomerase [Acidiferrobacteraceae bacterium]
MAVATVRPGAARPPQPCLTRGLVILGSTGSIGVNTLKVAALHPGRFRVVALTGNTQVERLYEQCQQFHPELAAMMDEQAAEELERRLRAAGSSVRVVAGIPGLCEAALLPSAQIVMAAIVGAAGLAPTLEAIRAGRRVLLANKESLVMLGTLMMDEAAKFSAEILPIDSEHNAVFQCLPAGTRLLESCGVRRILLTCSGGPFRTSTLSQLEHVTPDEACAHPNWRMGRKISVDSATLMNKGLEVIEACHLFGATTDMVDVVIHPQSVVHSLVEYRDGSMLAQLGNPDMRTPIAYALGWPERIDSGVASLDLAAIGHFDFERPDSERFPCLALAYAAGRRGGTAPAVLNAANEVAVGAFLAGQIAFTRIPQVIESVLSSVPVEDRISIETVLQYDAMARAAARELVVHQGRRAP